MLELRPRFGADTPPYRIRHNTFNVYEESSDTKQSDFFLDVMLHTILCQLLNVSFGSIVTGLPKQNFVQTLL